MKRIPAIFKFLVVFLFLTACRFPNDPNHTLENIINTRIINVGRCENVGDKKLKTVETNLLDQLANNLHAKINLTVDSQEALYHKLVKHDLDIVACQITPDSPWNNKIGFTYPYYEIGTEKISYVLAVPSGENAWLKYVNEFIFQNRETHTNVTHNSKT